MADAVRRRAKAGGETIYYGEVAEWLKAAVLKTVKDESPSRVRIPPSPQNKNILKDVFIIDFLLIFCYLHIVNFFLRYDCTDYQYTLSEVDMPTQRKPIVLILEDEGGWHARFRDALSGDFTVVIAVDAREASHALDETHKNPWLVAVDGLINSLTVDSFWLIKNLRKRRGFTGPMVAISGLENLRNEMTKRGCSHACEKSQLAELVRRLHKEQKEQRETN